MEAHRERAWGWIVQLGVACTAAGIATLVRLSLEPWVGADAPLLVFLLASYAAATIRGTACGIAATFLGASAGWYFFVEPRFSFGLPDPGGVGALAVYLAMGSLVSTLAGSLARTRGLLVAAKARAEAALIRAERALASEREARAEAEQLGRVREEFLAVVSHELRTPLNAVVGFAHLLSLRMRDGGDPEMGRMVTIIERNARAQARLIEDVLDVARVLRGKLALELTEVDLVDSVRIAVESARPAADEKGVGLEMDLGRAPAVVRGEQIRLEQIARNLVSNAIKFTPRGGRVLVRIDRVDDRAVLVVRDTGAGIAADFLPHVFDAFAQQQRSTRSGPGGLGLGLAIVKQLADAHGGSVRAESAGPERGTELRVELPMLPLRASEPARLRSAAADGELLEGVRVLVVEDDRDSLDVATTALRLHGATVDGASSAGEALARWQRATYDVLVSDLALPDHDGTWLLRELRARSEHPTPAIAVSAHARDEDVRRARHAGFGTYLAKPVDPFELARAVARIRSPRPAGERIGECSVTAS